MDGGLAGIVRVLYAERGGGGGVPASAVACLVGVRKRWEGIGVMR